MGNYILTIPILIKNRKWSGSLASVIANLLPKGEEGWLTIGAEKIVLRILSRDGDGTLLGVDNLEFCRDDLFQVDSRMLRISGLPVGQVDKVPIEFQGDGLRCTAILQIPQERIKTVCDYLSDKKYA